MSIHHWFIPHRQTHQKAKLLSWQGILVYVLIFILLQVSISIVGYSKPGVLGVSSNIDVKTVIDLTNQERAKKGLQPLVENEALGNAAAAKGANMLAEDYWAHFAPSGKSPWDFILASGYRFTYAGENLAKNFYTSPDVVTAWMNSPTHRDNLLNANYKDVGIAVVEGTLNGQKTTLVVQEFGTTENVSSRPVAQVSGKQIEVPKEDLTKPQVVIDQPKPQDNNPVLASVQSKPTIDPFQVTKYAALAVILLLGSLLLVDLLILYRRKVFRISSYHVAHMSILSISATSVLVCSPGSIL